MEMDGARVSSHALVPSAMTIPGAMLLPGMIVGEEDSEAPIFGTGQAAAGRLMPASSGTVRA
jgi:hypothetical protein